MSENKRFYWLKLKEDFFDEDTIAWIEEQENGRDYVLFYLKLCLKALKNKGILIRYVGDVLIPYDCASLADLTDTNIDTVRMAMVLFQKIGLINILDSGEIYLTQLQEMIGSETNKAELMRKKRAREKLKGNNVTQVLPYRYPILDIDKDIDINNIYSPSETENEPNEPTISKPKSNSSSKDERHPKDNSSLARDNKNIKSDFESIWKYYPRKEGKIKAFNYYCAWLKGRKCFKEVVKLTHEEMLIATKMYLVRCKKEKTTKEFIQLGSTFFSSTIYDLAMEYKGYEDEKKQALKEFLNLEVKENGS